MVTAEPLTTSRTLVFSTADTRIALTAGLVDVLVEWLIDELIVALILGVTLIGSDCVRAGRDGGKTRDGYFDEFS